MATEYRFKTAARPSVIWIGTLAAIALLVVLLHEILLPFMAGIALAYLLAPVVDRIERLGVNRTVAALGIVGVFIIGVGGVLVLVIPLLGSEIAAFIEKVPEYIARLQAFANNPDRPWLRKLIGEGLSEAGQSAGQIATMAADWIPTFLRSLWSDSQAVISILSLMVVTPIVTIYLLMDWKHLIALIDRSIPTAEREPILALVGEIDDTIAGFLRGQGTICLILAFYYALALWLIGTQSRYSDWPCRWFHQFHSLSRIVYRTRAVALCGGAPVLAELDDDSGRTWNLLCRAGDRGLCAVSLSHRVARPAQSRLGDVRDYCVRLSVWLRRASHCGAARRRDWCRHPFCNTATSVHSARAGAPAARDPSPAQELAEGGLLELTGV